MFHVLQKRTGLSLRRLAHDYATTLHLDADASAVYQRFRGYASGMHLPLADKERLMAWAVDMHPPCALAYHHVVWNVIELLDQRASIWNRWRRFRAALDKQTLAAIDEGRSAAKQALMFGFPVFSADELGRVARLDGIDAFAVLLVAKCDCLGRREDPGVELEICRAWLARWHQTSEGRAMKRPLRRALIEHAPRAEVLHF